MECWKTWCIENDHKGNCTNRYETNPYTCSSCVSTVDAMGSQDTSRYITKNGVTICQYNRVLR